VASLRPASLEYEDLSDFDLDPPLSEYGVLSVLALNPPLSEYDGLAGLVIRVDSGLCAGLILPTSSAVENLANEGVDLTSAARASIVEGDISKKTSPRPAGDLSFEDSEVDDALV